MTDKETLKGVIDRFEGDWAVIELDGEIEPRNISRKLLPRRAKEGDHVQLEIEHGNVTKVQVDPEATQAAKERIKEKMERLRRGEHLRDDD
ncbi:MAG: DUF3006 domain-containing protein [Anaerolineae bacterium]|nr:DUF3006 domain-containing protein [Anaerolineae bacterium]